MNEARALQASLRVMMDTAPSDGVPLSEREHRILCVLHIALEGPIAQERRDARMIALLRAIIDRQKREAEEAR